jgi:hypothetical protein
MAERSRTRRNTLERRCLGKAYKRLFVGSPKGIFKMLERREGQRPSSGANRADAGKTRAAIAALVLFRSGT